jgi:hypothetical protein
VSRLEKSKRRPLVRDMPACPPARCYRRGIVWCMPLRDPLRSRHPELPQPWEDRRLRGGVPTPALVAAGSGRRATARLAHRINRSACCRGIRHELHLATHGLKARIPSLISVPSTASATTGPALNRGVDSTCLSVAVGHCTTTRYGRRYGQSNRSSDCILPLR